MPILVVTEGPNRGALIRLAAGENRIGRDPALEVPLPDKSISRRHAAVVIAEDGAATLVDLGSTNATYLNGLRLTAPRPMRAGDELRVGDTVLLYLDDEATGAVVAEQASLDETAKIVMSAPPPAEPAVGAGLAVPPVRPKYLIGASEALARVSDLVARCAPLETTLLIRGESGTGKELVAEALHRLGPRRDAPFVIVNCANLEPALLESELFGHERGAFTGAVARKLGKLELVRNGTLFLDEVGELPLDAQAKLLRAIDRREFERVGGHDVLRTQARFIAATHRDLQALVREGGFREDLLFRLRVVEIWIPPLRERTDDIQPLVVHFLRELREKLPAQARRVGAAALEALRRYAFPGNVRELRNILERCLIFCDHEEIGLADLPPEARGPEAGAEAAPPRGANGGAGGAIATLDEVERAQILRALSATGGNKSQAAKLLAIDRNTLHAKMKRHGLAGSAGERADA